MKLLHLIMLICFFGVGYVEGMLVQQNKDQPGPLTAEERDALPPGYPPFSDQVKP